MEKNENDVMAVIDYTSQLNPGPGFGSMNDKYAIAEGNVVTINFSGWASASAGNDSIIATIPAALKSNVSNVFFTAFNHTRKTAVGCRINGTNIIANNFIGGDNYWIAVTYVKK